MAGKRMCPMISVVVPVFRSGPTLPALHARIADVLSGIASDWELILVDDASGDGTFGHMLALRNHDPRVRLVRFGRNMGQHHATLCGIKAARGDVVVTLDDDLQNPPEEIPAFLAKLDEGYDLVIGRIRDEKKHSAWRNFSSAFVQRLVGMVLGKPRDLSLSSYRAMTRRAASVLGTYRGVQTYLPALFFGLVPHERIANVDVAHDPRRHGASNYTLRKLLKLTSYLLINHSSIPLRLASALGLLTSVASAVFAAYLVLGALLHGTAVKGWTSLAVLITLVGGAILMSLGIVGEYIGRLLVESSAPEQFPVFETHG
jgi:undecaprenyl-phosphate 4-deoxy-4-formamido-L-arabinose transferase